jgi:hypothetical protein
MPVFCPRPRDFWYLNAQFGTELIIKPFIYLRIAIDMRRGTVYLSIAPGRVIIGI